MIISSIYSGDITMFIILLRARHLKNILLAIILLSPSHYSFAEFIELKGFGDNPGDLTASYYKPKINNSNSSPTPLVVLLHGCAQQAENLAKKSGLLGLAEQKNFTLLMPQQGLTNNVKRCFNWYSEEDFTKNKGETLSLKNMVTSLKNNLASNRVYIIGLSAGGAMASSLLVNYPDLFEAGAVVAGIPFPCADGLITGISCMKNGPSQSINELVTLINKIQPAQKDWPKLSVWTGANDSIVNPLNASMLAQHWSQLSKLTTPPIINKHKGYTISQWQNNERKVQIELVEVLNRDHGIMVNPELENGGEASDYLLTSPISTAKHVVKFWGL